LVKQVTRRFHWKLERAGKAIHKQFPINVHATSVNIGSQIVRTKKWRGENVSDERSIDAFVLGLCRSDLVEEMGITKPRKVSELMEIANRFADEENAYNTKRAPSPERDKPNRYNNQKSRSRNDDSDNPCNQVAAGYKRSSKEGGERRSSGYRRRDEEVTDQETSTYHPKTSLMDHVTYIMHT
jgi:hypothetical protein